MIMIMPTFLFVCLLGKQIKGCLGYYPMELENSMLNVLLFFFTILYLHFKKKKKCYFKVYMLKVTTFVSFGLRALFFHYDFHCKDHSKEGLRHPKPIWHSQQVKPFAIRLGPFASKRFRSIHLIKKFIKLKL